jgi:hypothetical protein
VLLAVALFAAPPAGGQRLEAPYQLEENLTDLGRGSPAGAGPVAHLADLASALRDAFSGKLRF